MVAVTPADRVVPVTRNWLAGCFDDGSATSRANWTKQFQERQVWTSFQDFENNWAQRAATIRNKKNSYLPSGSDGTHINVLTIGLTLSGTGSNSQAQNPNSLRAAAGGADESGWTQIAQAIKANGMDARSTVLRIGHEPNGTWYPWSTGSNSTLMSYYRSAWQRAHRAIRAVCSNVRFCLCLNNGLGGTAAIAGHYAGDSYVDLLGLDFYDYGKPIATTSDLFLAAQGQLGFAQLGDFAHAHGKQFSLNEWAVGNGPNPPRDNPYYVEFIFNSLVYLNQRYPGIVSHDSYFNSSGSHNLGNNPRAAAQYKSLWLVPTATPRGSYAVDQLVWGSSAKIGITGA